MKKLKNFLKSKFVIYYYDKEELVYKRIKRRYMVLICLFFIALFSFYTPLVIKRTIIQDFYEPQTIVINTNDTTYDFSEEKLIQLIIDLNLKFPHIVLAQAKLETGDFTSNIFRENHNLFGMREARVRINIARGTQYNHAYYNNWYESVYDYAFYQSRYLSKLRTEEEYFNYLDESYAEAPNYVETLKGMIGRENLKELFEN